MEDWGVEFAHNVAGRRRDLRLSQADLADLAGVSERFVRDLEGGKATVRLDKVNAVLHALGLQFRLVSRL